MSPPPRPHGLARSCRGGHAIGTSPDRRVVAVGLVLVGAPFVIGAVWSVMIADEALGPLITFAVWTALFVVRIARSKGGVYFVEWFAVIGCVVMLQLLLDLRTPYLGDLVVGALHAAFGLALLVGAWRDRARRRAAETERGPPERAS